LDSRNALDGVHAAGEKCGMEKKYQIFVSSTYMDLVDERQAVTRAILDMGHIPAGMEMFPAADVEQLDYIKKVIDECDYYVLIVGARYGSLDGEGVSYTEREYDYAIDTGKTVLAFLHHDTDQIVSGKTDKDDTKRKKLTDFTNRVKMGRLVQQWSNAQDLRSAAVVSLQKSFSSNPQVGWMRADRAANSETMADIIKYRKENDDLKKKIDFLELSNIPKYEDAAGLESEVIIEYSFYTIEGRLKGNKKLTLSSLLVFMAPALHTASALQGAVDAVNRSFIDRFHLTSRSFSVNESQIQDILLHFVATGHVNMYVKQIIDQQKNVTEYQLTAAGSKHWKESSYIRNQDG
jgi:hypothetical protein